jgi:hypothetical protein
LEKVGGHRYPPGSVAIGEDRETPRKTTEQSRVIKAGEKTQDFYPKKEKQTFEEARKGFRRDWASSSKARP